MIPALLTSLERVRSAANLTVKSYDSDLLADLAAASAMIQAYMSRPLKVAAREETRWATPSGITFLKAFPVQSVASVLVADGLGGWRTLSPAEFWWCDDNELHLVPAIRARAAIRITYTGGLAAPVLRFSATVASSTGDIAAEVVTVTGGITGKIVSWDDKGGVAIIEASGDVAPGVTVTGTAFSFVVAESSQDLDMSTARDLAKACEMQAVYMYQRRNSLGRTATTTGGTTTFTGDYDLLPGVKRVCDLYDPQLVA